jgi:predicted nucleotidyltransferase
VKIETARRYAREIHERVKAVNGLLGTPGCSDEAVRIRRIWVFGSAVKGSQAPNDLDVLIDLHRCGRSFSGSRHQARIDRRYLANHGVRVAVDSKDACLKWLTDGMRKVSRHCTDTETVDIDVKVEIYPRFML